MVDFQRARKLPMELSNWFKEYIGQQFTHYTSGPPGDSRIGLIHENSEVIELSVSGQNVQLLHAIRYKILFQYSPQLVLSRGFIKKILQLDNNRNERVVDIVNAPKDSDELIKKMQILYESLSPLLQSAIYCFDLGPLQDWRHGTAVGTLGLTRFNRDYCGVIGYHEVAHLRTRKYMSEHSIETPYEIYDWIEAVQGAENTKGWKGWYAILPTNYGIVESGFDENANKDANEYGFVSHYAAINPNEDISETTACIYTRPKLYKQLMSQNEIFIRKLEFLNKNGYIRQDQYDYLTGKTNKIPIVLPPECLISDPVKK